MTNASITKALESRRALTNGETDQCVVRIESITLNKQGCIPVTAPCQSGVSHQCNGACYKEVEIHVASYCGGAEGHSVIHHTINEPKLKKKQQQKKCFIIETSVNVNVESFDYRK